MSFFAELKRRNVIRVAAAYLIVSWLIMQAGEVMSPALNLPGWVNSMLAFFLILGFPVAIVFAWAFEMTPEGLKKEKEVDRSDSIANVTGQKLNYTIIVLMAVALAYFAWDKFAASPANGVGQAQETTAADLTVASNDSVESHPDKKSIAVIPFRNRSANEENAEFFSDGVHDELLTNLSRISELKVISRTSVMSYRDTTKNLRQIGEELGVANILEGGVQRVGNTVRINVQLIDAATDEHLWAKTYDRELSTENIFAIQTEIAQSIANALEATLTPGEQQLLAKIPTANLMAYDNFLIARQLNNRGNWQDLREAQAYLNKAIELDPDFAQAYTLLARTYNQQINTGAVTLQEVKAGWEAAIQKALSLDSDSATTQAAYAQFLWMNKLEGVNEAFEKARQLEPANADIMAMHAQYLRRTSQLERALQTLQSARELDPVSIRVLFGLARIYELRRETDRALKLYARIRQIDPANPSGIGPVSGVYMTIGDIVQSTRWLFKAIEVDAEDSDLSNFVARAYSDFEDYHFEDYQRAYQWLSWIEQNQSFNPLTVAGLAELDIYAGHTDTAVELAQQTLDGKTSNRWYSEEIAFRILLIWATEHSQAGAALEWVRQSRPDLLESTPHIDDRNLLQAVDTAHLLQMDGQNALAENLLKVVIAVYEDPYALPESWAVTAKAQALALLGEKQAALEELRKQVDNGWRVLWRLNTELNPNFESLKNDPEFQAIIDFLRKDMARQLEELRAMEASGEIPMPPGEEIS